MVDSPAFLVHGAIGLGLWDSLYRAARAKLCESPVVAASSGGVFGPDDTSEACGKCAACHLMAAGTHPDLMLLVPESLELELGIAQPKSTESLPASGEKRALSKEIGIDAIRLLIDWTHATSHRGHAKAAVIFPLDAMAMPAANAMLKTLEEPPAGLYFYMGTHHLDRVLATIRSRCRLQSMQRPARGEALELLRARGVADPEMVAAWCRNAAHDAEPQRGMEWARKLVSGLAEGPEGLAAGAESEPAPSMPVAVVALQKISVDLLRVQHGVDPLYLPGEKTALSRLAAGTEGTRIQLFWKRLATFSRTANFPLHTGLASDGLLLEFRQLFSRGAH